MKDSSTIQKLKAIVVGKDGDEFVRQVYKLLNDYEIELICCNNVYTAVSQLAKKTHNNTVVIGRLEQLSREKGRFLQKIREKDIVCCCLVEGNSEQKRRQISAAKQMQAIIINEPAEIEEIMLELSAGDSASPLKKKANSGSSASVKDEFAVSKAELEALLGGQSSEPVL